MPLAFLQSVHYTNREVFDGDYPKDFQARLIHDLALTRERVIGLARKAKGFSSGGL